MLPGRNVATGGSTPAVNVTGTIHALGAATSDSGPIPRLPGSGDDLPAGAHVLVVARGPSSGMRLELKQSPTTVGRSADTAIFLDDITVSRRHAQFETAGEGWALRDLGSLNGTYVNREPIDRQELNSGDEIQIGKYRFEYLVGGQPRP